MPSKPSARSQAQSMLSGLFERGEEVVSVFLDELSRNPRVREQLGKTVERAVDAKRAVDKNMQAVLGVLNVPSRADYHRVLTKIEALQGSIVNLSLKVDRLLAAQHVSAPHAPAHHAAPAAAKRKRRAKKKPAA
ncbi:MAG: hypothetical protein SF182_26425 [Deltaproteobacteria bacterium]|nr:hypothetical protein [Deltaproteobacteria bacterium]